MKDNQEQKDGLEVNEVQGQKSSLCASFNSNDLLVSTEPAIRPATIEDMKYITSLANKEGKAIGFIPKVAYESAINGKKPSIHRWSDTCNDKIWICEENGDPVGFVMMSYGNVAKVNQICIQEDARLIERGKVLLNTAIQHGENKGILDFSCGCADDLESNKFWTAMKWKKIYQRKGIHFSNTYKESSNRIVNIYRFQIASLFSGG